MDDEAARFLVRAPDPAGFEVVGAILRPRVRIFVELPQRLLFSTGPLPADVRQRIEALGAVVRPETRHGIG